MVTYTKEQQLEMRRFYDSNFYRTVNRAYKDQPDVVFNNEAGLLVWLVRFLVDTGWEVFQEVSVAGGYCDVVARREIDGKLVTWAIEGKMACNSEVILQAERHLDTFDYVSICTPMKPNPIYEEYMEDYGIGCLVISKPELIRGKWAKDLENKYDSSKYMFFTMDWGGLKEYVAGFKTGKNECLDVELVARKNKVTHTVELHELHKLEVAGKQSGERVTPYKLSVLRMQEYLKDKESALIDDMIKDLGDGLHWHSKKPGIDNVVLKWEKDKFEFIKVNKKKHIKLR